jgi:hypothetical protein
MCGWYGALTCGDACGCSGESALGAVEAATAEAEKHAGRSEQLAALVAEAREMLEQAKTEQAERARAAAEAAAAAAVKVAAEAAAAAQRLHMEEEMSALTLRMQTRRTEDAERCTAAAADARSDGEQRRASCRVAPGGDGVRGVHGRAQGPPCAAVRAPVRVWAVCPAAPGAGRVVPSLSRARREDSAGLLLSVGSCEC